MVLVDVKCLEGHFFLGNPSCQLPPMKSQRYYCIPSTVYDVIYDTFIVCTTYIWMILMGYLCYKMWFLHELHKMKQDLDLLPSRCFLKSWHLMREDSGMGWRKSKFLSLWSRRGKQMGPPKASFVVFLSFFFGAEAWLWEKGWLVAGAFKGVCLLFTFFWRRSFVWNPFDD